MTSAINPDRYMIGDVDIDWLKQDFTAAKAEIGQAQADIETLQDDVTALETATTALDGRLDTAEAAITEIDAEVTAAASAAASASTAAAGAASDAAEALTAANAALNKTLAGPYEVPDLVTRQGQARMPVTQILKAWAGSTEGDKKFMWAYTNSGTATLYMGDMPFSGVAISNSINWPVHLEYCPLDHKFYLTGLNTSGNDIQRTNKSGVSDTIATSDMTETNQSKYSSRLGKMIIAGFTSAKSGLLVSSDASSWTYTQIVATGSLSFRIRESGAKLALIAPSTGTHRFIYTSTDAVTWTANSFNSGWLILAGDFEQETGEFYALFAISGAVVLKKTSDFSSWTDVFTFTTGSTSYMRYYKTAKCFVIWGSLNSAINLYCYKVGGKMMLVPLRNPAYASNATTEWAEDEETGIFNMLSDTSQSTSGLLLGV